MTKNVPFNVLRHANHWEVAPRGPMAAAIGTSLGFSATTLFGGSAITLFGGAITISTASIVGSLVLSAVTSWASKALAPKNDFGSSGSQGLLVNTKNVTGPQQFVYGQIRKGGTVSYYESTGTNNNFLHQIIVLAGHEIQSVQNIYLDDKIVSLDSSGFVTDDDWVTDSDDKKVRIYYHLGNQTSASTDFANVSGKNLANTLISESELEGDNALDSNFVGKGLSYIYVRYEYDRDIFASGVPTVTAEIQGKKIFDPRNSNHVLGNPSTWEYSNNAALCIRDFLYSEYGLSDDKINDVSFAAAANECDENVTIYSSTVENRYSLDGVVDANRPIGGVLEDMVTACAGTLFYGAGQWLLKAGAYTSPVKTFTDDDFRSGIDLDTKISMRDTFNAVQGTYISKVQDYISADYPQISSSSYLSEDNNVESILDLPLPFTTSEYSAQRLAKLTLLRGREQMVFSADFGTEAMEVEVGDIIQITHNRYSFSNNKFEVIGWKLAVNESQGLVVKMNLRQTSQEAFDWNTADATAATVAATIVPSSSDNSTIGSITATNTGYTDGDGTFVSRITLAWPDAVGGNHSHFEIDHKLNTASQYQTIISSASVVSIVGYQKDNVVNYRIRPVNLSGVSGAYTTVASITVAGDTVAPNVPSNISASGAFRSVSVNWTNPTASDFSHVEVYRSVTNTSSSSSLISTTAADYFVDAPLAGDSTFYYWLKSVDYSGNKSGFSAGANATTNLIEGSDIPDGLITETKISDDSISTNKIQANAISANKLAADSVTAGAIQAGAITSAKISVNDLSAINANMGSITAGNLLLGNLSVNATNMKPTSGVGIKLENDGDLAFGTPTDFVSFDASAGVLTIQGKVVNIAQRFLDGLAGDWISIESSVSDLSNHYAFTEGPGFYRCILLGAGGSGATAGDNGSACGGGAGGTSFFSFDWDGTTNISCSIAGEATGNSYAGQGNSSGPGIAGAASTFSIGGNVRIRSNGGGGGSGSGGTASGGAGGYGELVASSNFISDTQFRSGGRGGNITGDPGGGQASGGGGIGFLANNGGNGGDCAGNASGNVSSTASGGGSMFGDAPANNSTGGTLGSFPEGIGNTGSILGQYGTSSAAGGNSTGSSGNSGGYVGGGGSGAAAINNTQSAKGKGGGLGGGGGGGASNDPSFNGGGGGKGCLFVLRL